MRCPSCQEINSAGATRCGRCGSRLEWEAPETLADGVPAGLDLDARLGEKKHGLPIDEVVSLASEFCTVLESAHAQGRFHGALRPSSIPLAGESTASEEDDWLNRPAGPASARFSEIGGEAARYLSPEQALGDPPDAGSDLYALGATLYAMVTGQPPFRGSTAVTVISQHLHTPPVAPRWHRPDLPEGLDSLILDLLAKDPQARPASAAVVSGRLRALRAISVTAPRSPLAETDTLLDRLASGVFVGREEEVARLCSSLDISLGERFGVALLVGDAGIGKTRMAEELGTYARMRGVEVLWGRCGEGGGAPPFGPWLEILRSYVGDREAHELVADLGIGAGDIAELVAELRDALPGLAPPPRLPPEHARFRLFESVVGLLRNASRRRPLTLVLDDLHLVDESSLLLFEFLLREIGPARLLVVATCGRERVGDRETLRRILDDLDGRQEVEKIELGGLEVGDVGHFLRDTTRVEWPQTVSDAVWGETDGNPFHLHEVVRLLAEEGRIDAPSRGGSSLQLPEGVFGVLARRLSHLSSPCREVLTLASVIGLELDPGLLQPPAGRSESGVAEALREALAARILVEGAEGRYRFSHELVREAVYRELTESERAAKHRSVGESLELAHAGEPGPWLGEIARHFSKAVTEGDPARSIAASERAAAWAGSRLAWEEAVAHLGRAVQIVELSSEQDSSRARELERLKALISVALSNSEKSGDAALLSRILGARQFGVAISSERDMLDEGKRIVLHAREEGDREAEANGLGCWFWAAIWLCDIEAAQEVMKEERELAKELATPMARYIPLAHAAMLAILQGRFADAEGCIRESHSVAGDDLEESLARWTGAQNLVLSRLSGGSVAPDPVLALGDRYPHSPIYRAFVCAVYAANGDWNDARRELGVLAGEKFALIPRDENWLATVLLAADVSWDLQEPRYASSLYEMLGAYAGRCHGIGPMVVCLGPTDLRLGYLSALSGDSARAEKHFVDSVAVSEGLGATPFLALSRLALAKTLLQRSAVGSVARAIEERDLALVLAREVGMAGVVAAAEALSEIQ